MIKNDIRFNYFYINNEENISYFGHTYSQW